MQFYNRSLIENKITRTHQGKCLD